MSANVGLRQSCPLCASTSCVVEMSTASFALLACTQCGLVFSSQMASSSDIYENAYTEEGEYTYYQGIDTTKAVNALAIPWPMRKFLNSQSTTGTLLDVGCSTGKFLLAAQKAGWHVYGVDISTTAVRTAQLVTQAPVWAGSLDDMDSTIAFNAITAWEVLEHLPAPMDFLRETHTRLLPGGVLGLSVPNWRSPWMKRSAAPEHWPPFHLTFWTKPVLHKALTEAGFQDIHIQEKPFAWGEEVGRLKWFYLPIALIRSVAFGHKGMHLAAIARKHV